MSEHPKLATIRALLAKAESSDYEGEAETYRAKAFQLMAEHGVEQTMLDAHKPVDSRETVVNRFIEVEGKWALAKARFLQRIVVAMRGQAVRYTGASDKARTEIVRVYGYPSDLDRAELLWTSLCLQLYTAVNRTEIPWHIQGYKGEVRAFRNSLVMGFVSEVADRVREREQWAAKSAEQSPAGSGTALVLADRETAVEAIYRKDNPKIVRNNMRISNERGYEAGQREGRRANIGGTGLGQTGQRAIG